MSKILFSVLCVLLSFVMLFTFVRASFDLKPLTARNFLNEVSNISMNFDSTESAFKKMKSLLGGLKIPEWKSSTLEEIDTDNKIFEYGWQFHFPIEKCEIKDDGSVVAPNKVVYTKWEVDMITSEEVYFNLYFSPRVWKGVFSNWFGSESKILNGIAKALAYMVDFFTFFLDLALFLFSILDAIFVLLVDTVVFAIDCVLLLLHFIGLSEANTVATV